MKQTLSFADIWLYVLIVSMSISISLIESSGRFNMALVVIMTLSPLIVLRYPTLDSNDFLLISFLSTIIVFPVIMHPETMRWSTVLYSGIFCTTFLAYKRLLRYSVLTVADYKTLIKYIIYAYSIALVIQQCCVLIGLPVFNVMSGYNPAEPWKLNSLAAEPSWTSRTMGLLMYCYIVSKEIVSKEKYDLWTNFKPDKLIWISFIWVMVTSISGTAFLFVFIILLKVVRLRTIIPSIAIACIILVLVEVMGITAMDRTKKVIVATMTLNEKEIVKADGSASFRIVPGIVGAKSVGLATVEGWFGHGIDSSASLVSKHLQGGYTKFMVGAGPFTIWYEYGFFSFLIFNLFSFSVCVRRDDLMQTFILWFMLVFISGINTQIPWMAIIFLTTNKFLAKQY